MHSFSLCCHRSEQRKSDSQTNKFAVLKTTPTFTPHDNLKNLQQYTMAVSSCPLLCMFSSHMLPPPPPQHFHSLAQTALALTPGHPMLSLSNYLTNRSETALISAYCSASLNTGSLGGLSGKLWCEDQQAGKAEKAEQQKSTVRSQEPPIALRIGSLRTCSISYGPFTHLVHPCLMHGGSSYGLIDSHSLHT